MDGVFNNMDFRIKHWLGYTRRFPSPYPVASANLVNQKDHWIRTVFDTCNFSLILRGHGQFNRLGRTWEVVAPCVITQWPGEQLEYGPNLPEETWDEFYIIYGRELRPRFVASGLVDTARPVWPIHDLGRVQSLIAEYAALADSANPEAVVDRVDRVCERLVLETLLDADADNSGDTPLGRLLGEVRREFTGPVDFDALASRHGLSRATFRRRWAEVMDKPPARYLQELRMREACRLLAETTRPIREIATAVGFEDELYFSRRFRLEQGRPPSDYRKIYSLRSQRQE